MCSKQKKTRKVINTSYNKWGELGVYRSYPYGAIEAREDGLSSARVFEGNGTAEMNILQNTY